MTAIRLKKKRFQKKQEELRAARIIGEDEEVTGVIEEVSYGDTLQQLEEMESKEGAETQVIPVESIEMYKIIAEFDADVLHGKEALVCTKYKTVDKKVKPAAGPLPVNSEERRKEVTADPMLRKAEDIGHTFTNETRAKLRIGTGGFLLPEEERIFRGMLERHGKAFAFTPKEIGCADPKIVEPMVIFTVDHVPWSLKPIPIPRAYIPKLIELLKEKVAMGVLEPSSAPYSNRWFTVPKKNGSLRFIQDLQPVNKVTIRNSGVGPIVDEFAEEFAGRAIYSIGDLYSGYDQFQLVVGSRDITTMRTPIGLVRMCTLPQGATNSVAHIMNAMNKVLRDCIPEITMPFLDDIPIKGCAVDEKEESTDAQGCRKFVADHIRDCEKVLQRLEEAQLTLSGEKSMFGQREILVVGHLCGPYGRKPSPAKVDAIQAMKESCESQSEVRRFLGACAFYHVWIPHYAHLADPLYCLLRKGRQFGWTPEHTKTMRRLKEALQRAVWLKRPNYAQPIIVTIDTSPTGIGWVINQEDAEGNRHPIRFGAKVLNERQRKYAQVKRELWGIVSAVKTDRDYLIGAEVVIETDCLPVLGMLRCCTIPDVAMLRWVAYIKSLNPEVCHIAGKDNAVADMLSRARFGDCVTESDNEDVLEDYFSSERVVRVSTIQEFREEEYEGDSLRIGRMLSELEGASNNTGGRDRSRDMKRLVHKFFLSDGLLWREPKKLGESPLRVVGTVEQQRRIMSDFHESEWAGHRGTWATFAKIKQRYWWKGMYRDVARFVETCEKCQAYSTVRHRDGLHPTFSPAINFKWMVDIVSMPTGIGQRKYLVLAREDLTNQVEGRALRKKTCVAVCQFLFEEVFCRYGCVGQVVADRGELDSDEARQFFTKFGVRLTLTTAYNPEANGKIERGHGPIVKALVKACDGRTKLWPQMLPYALWADRTTHSTVTGYMPAELMIGQIPVMPVESSIMTWSVLPWKEGMSREELLEVRIRQLERRPKDVEEAVQRQRGARLRSKQRFDRNHRLRPRKLDEGDWVIVYDNSLDHQHSSVRKFARRWFGPYEVRQIYDNGTYRLCELDGTMLRTPIAGKRVKLFKKRNEAQPCVTTDDVNEGAPTDIQNESMEDSDREIEIVIDLAESEDASYED